MTTTPRPVTVVHRHRDAYDVYIGRGSIWGNPYIIGRDGDRAEVIRKYEEYLASSPKLIARLPELTGKRIACYCAPQPCHGDVLKRWAEATYTQRDEWDEVQQAGREMWNWEPKDEPEDPYDDRPAPGALTIEEADDLERFHTRPRVFNPAAEWRARRISR